MINIYELETCPYCKKVIDFMENNKIPYKKIDIANPQNEEELITLGGKRQVPFIVDKENNVEMYESSEIIDYLGTLI